MIRTAKSERTQTKVLATNGFALMRRSSVDGGILRFARQQYNVSRERPTREVRRVLLESEAGDGTTGAAGVVMDDAGLVGTVHVLTGATDILGRAG